MSKFDLSRPVEEWHKLKAPDEAKWDKYKKARLQFGCLCLSLQVRTEMVVGLRLIGFCLLSNGVIVNHCQTLWSLLCCCSLLVFCCTTKSFSADLTIENVHCAKCSFIHFLMYMIIQSIVQNQNEDELFENRHVFQYINFIRVLQSFIHSSVYSFIQRISHVVLLQRNDEKQRYRKPRI